jgi:hypothetical protein
VPTRRKVSDRTGHRFKFSKLGARLVPYCAGGSTECATDTVFHFAYCSAAERGSSYKYVANSCILCRLGGCWSLTRSPSVNSSAGGRRIHKTNHNCFQQLNADSPTGLCYPYHAIPFNFYLALDSLLELSVRAARHWGWNLWNREHRLRCLRTQKRMR